MASPFEGQDGTYLLFNTGYIVIGFLLAWITIYVLYTVIPLYVGGKLTPHKKTNANWLIGIMTALSALFALGIVSFASSTWTALLAIVIYGLIIWRTTTNSIDVINNEIINELEESFRAVLPISVTLILASLFTTMTSVVDK